MACVGHRLQCATINFYTSITSNDGLMFFVVETLVSIAWDLLNSTEFLHNRLQILFNAHYKCIDSGLKIS